MPVRIAKQAIYCPNYIIHDVVSLYQTTASLPDDFLELHDPREVQFKAMQREKLVAYLISYGKTHIQKYYGNS